MSHSTTPLDDGDDWADPEPEYAPEYERCPHGVAPKWDCDWCADAREDRS